MGGPAESALVLGDAPSDCTVNDPGAPLAMTGPLTVDPAGAEKGNFGH